MQCKVIINEVGNARAKGQVEKTHNIIERHFEGRFPYAAEMLGRSATSTSWARSGLRPTARTACDSRHGEPRYSVWMTIGAEQLRVPAAVEVLRELVTSEPESAASATR